MAVRLSALITGSALLPRNITFSASYTHHFVASHYIEPGISCKEVYSVTATVTCSLGKADEYSLLRVIVMGIIGIVQWAYTISFQLEL
jgi:hypothetical protein